jgi:hypothetical protein
MKYKRMFYHFEVEHSKLGEKRPPVSEYIAERFEEVQAIREKLNKLGQSRNDEKSRHRLALDGLDKEIRDVQASCNHPVTTHNTDPSGNHDSCTTCDVCGFEIKHAYASYDG